MKSLIYLAIIVTAIYAQNQPVKGSSRKNAIFLVIVLASGLYISEAVMTLRWRNITKDLDVIAASDRVTVTRIADNFVGEYGSNTDEHSFFIPVGLMTPKKKLPPFRELKSFGEVVYYIGDREVMSGEIFEISLKEPYHDLNKNEKYITGWIDGTPCIIKIDHNYFGIGNYYLREISLS